MTAATGRNARDRPRWILGKDDRRPGSTRSGCGTVESVDGCPGREADVWVGIMTGPVGDWVGARASHAHDVGVAGLVLGRGTGRRSRADPPTRASTSGDRSQVLASEQPEHGEDAGIDLGDLGVRRLDYLDIQGEPLLQARTRLRHGLVGRGDLQVAEGGRGQGVVGQEIIGGRVCRTADCWPGS